MIQPPLTLPQAHDLVQRLQRELNLAPPQAILQCAFGHFGPAAAVAFSGAEDVALLGLCRDFELPFRVFFLDTGRLPPDTLELVEAVRQKLGIATEVFSPQAPAVEALVRAKGLFSFYRDGHGECCGVRKVEPLARALASSPAWLTGQRRDQSPATRAEVPVVQVDLSHSRPDAAVLKWNPLARWTSAQVWKYIRAADLPYNALHLRGYVSVGCAPCTRPVLPGQHEREGRWWWEDAERKECGLHATSEAGDR